MKFKRKISQWGGSTGISIPQDLLNFYNLEKGDDIEIEDTDKGILIKGASNDTNTDTIE